ncbi:MAG: hypothetical protein A2Z21_02075 [Candidatus Fraserbacteria bacterium RBG_16_55_9]|uniref:DNA-3-methyladenine glycosylase II n=1 Tax=Fraserbacteria sp. (strain RBG_16_55_9) TaxID=1817864 RepID=A0A1F5V1L9_FRAXR|nr:MAG: hypothetical protein A2Z21_02075 [Candidatus Fraserbacteria bacterium RBG_16_55_9]
MAPNVKADVDQATESLRLADPILGRAIVRIGRCTLTPTGEDPFTAFAESILYQQLSGKAAETIIKRLKALFDHDWPSPEQLLATPEDRLRAAGVSWNKIRALKDLATKTTDGTLDFAHLANQTDAEIISHATQVRGIGRWTAEMFLIFTLGRPDVFPVDDLGIQKGIQKLYGYRKLPAKRTMLRHAGKWRPFRTVASWYLWRVVSSD